MDGESLWAELKETWPLRVAWLLRAPCQSKPDMLRSVQSQANSDSTRKLGKSKSYGSVPYHEYAVNELD